MLCGQRLRPEHRNTSISSRVFIPTQPHIRLSVLQNRLCCGMRRQKFGCNGKCKCCAFSTRGAGSDQSRKLYRKGRRGRRGGSVEGWSQGRVGPGPLYPLTELSKGQVRKRVVLG